MSTLYVVTLYPYEDGSEARFQFDTREMAEAFAAKVRELPEKTLDYVTGDEKTVEVWESGTYESVTEAWIALTDWAGDEDDDDA